MTHSTHAFAADLHNDDIRIDINGTLYARAEAKVSVFSSGFVLGDCRKTWTATLDSVPSACPNRRLAHWEKGSWKRGQV